MPSYDYNCEKCDTTATFVRSIHVGPKPEDCHVCGNPMNRVFSLPLIIGAAVESAEYNPAFGKVVKNKRERDELAKRHGMIEVGNEKPQTIHKEAERTQQENRNKKWSKD